MSVSKVLSLIPKFSLSGLALLSCLGMGMCGDCDNIPDETPTATSVVKTDVAPSPPAVVFDNPNGTGSTPIPLTDLTQEQRAAYDRLKAAGHCSKYGTLISCGETYHPYYPHR